MAEWWEWSGEPGPWESNAAPDLWSGGSPTFNEGGGGDYFNSPAYQNFTGWGDPSGPAPVATAVAAGSPGSSVAGARRSPVSLVKVALAVRSSQPSAPWAAVPSGAPRRMKRPGYRARP